MFLLLSIHRSPAKIPGILWKILQKNSKIIYKTPAKFWNSPKNCEILQKTAKFWHFAEILRPKFRNSPEKFSNFFLYGSLEELESSNKFQRVHTCFIPFHWSNMHIHWIAYIYIHPAKQCFIRHKLLNLNYHVIQIYTIAPELSPLCELIPRVICVWVSYLMRKNCKVTTFVSVY